MDNKLNAFDIFYIVAQIIFSILAVIYNFKINIFNAGLNHYLKGETNIIIKSFLTFQYMDGAAYKYLMGGTVILMVAVASFVFTLVARDNFANPVIIILGLLINVIIAGVTLVLVANPILIGFFVLMIVGGLGLYSVNS